jgi:hypothetical protein
MPLRPLEEEETVVVGEFGAAVEVQEGGYVFSGCVVDELDCLVRMGLLMVLRREEREKEGTYVASLEVEPAREELVGACEIRYAEAKVAEFVDWGWACSC